LENTDKPSALYGIAIFTKNFSEFMHIKNCFCNNILVSSTGERPHNIHLQATVLSFSFTDMFFAWLTLERNRMFIKSALDSTTKYHLEILEVTSRFREKSAQINHKLDNPCTDNHEYNVLTSVQLYENTNTTK
jgi:hypothetical protein